MLNAYHPTPTRIAPASTHSLNRAPGLKFRPALDWGATSRRLPQSERLSLAEKVWSEETGTFDGAEPPNHYANAFGSQRP